MRQKLKTRYSQIDEHTKQVIKISIPAILVRVIGMLFFLVLSVFVAREIGAAGVGVLAIATQLSTILIILGLLGTERVILKEVAIAESNSDNGRIKNIINSAILFTILFSSILSFVLFFLTDEISLLFFKEPLLVVPLIISVLLIGPQIVSRIIASGLTGIGKVWQSGLIDQILSAFVTSIFFLIFYLLEMCIFR